MHLHLPPPSSYTIFCLHADNLRQLLLSAFNAYTGPDAQRLRRRLHRLLEGTQGKLGYPTCRLTNKAVARGMAAIHFDLMLTGIDTGDPAAQQPGFKKGARQDRSVSGARPNGRTEPSIAYQGRFLNCLVFSFPDLGVFLQGDPRRLLKVDGMETIQYPLHLRASCVCWDCLKHHVIP